jgi:thymidylate kinase
MNKENFFLKPLFFSLNQEKIEYGILRNYSKLPKSLDGSDLDILVSEKHLDKFYYIFNKILMETNGKVISKSISVAPKICVLGGAKENYYGIQFDIHHGIIPYKVFGILDIDFVLSRLKNYKNIKVVDSNDASFLAFLQKIFYNSQCKKYFHEAKNAWNINKKLYIIELNFKYSQKFIHLLDDVLSSNSYNHLKVKKLGTLGVKELTKGTSNRLKVIQSTLKKLYRTINPFGYTIAFIGVDGAGKTTIINKISPILSAAVHNEIYYEHMRPNLLPSISSLFGKNKSSKVVTNPHDKNPSGFFGSMFRLAYYSLDYIFGYWFKVYPSIVKKPSLWIFDRYFYDYLIDQKRGRINLPLWIIEGLSFFIPKPNLIICLGGNPKLIYERKKEISLKEVQRQIDSLKLFSNQQGNAFWVDTTENIDKTFEVVIELIKENMNKRVRL